MGLMKKLTSVVVTAGLLLGLVGTAAAAYPDGVAAAAGRMHDLGLVNGKVQGSSDLQLNDPITRAELVTIIVRAFGKANDAKFLKGAAAFPDTASHWASGEIALAKNMIEANGFSMGMPDGTFAPDAKLTTAQAVAFVMKFLGAPRDASQAWPNDYLNGAVAAGLMSADDKAALEAVANNDANRGLAFYLADEAFYSYKMADGKTVYTEFVKPTAPTVTLDEVAPTTKATATVSGSVSSDATAVYVGSMANEVTVTAGKFSADVDLTMGDNNISVMATDLAGNTTTKTLTITRTVGTAASIDAPATLTVKAGDTVDLAAAVKDADGNTISDAVLTATGDAGTLADGKFTAATKAGDYTLTLTSGDLTATVAVTVTAADIASIAVTPATVNLAAGAVQKFAAAGVDQYGNTVDLSTVTWSASAGVIDQSGNFAGTGAGNITVTATSGESSGTATATVYGVATALKLSAAGNLTADGSSTTTATISAVDANGNPVPNATNTVSLTSGNASVFTVAPSQVQLVNGTATVTLTDVTTSGSTAYLSATAAGLTGASALITAQAQTIGSIQLVLDPATMGLGNTNHATVTAKVLDTNGVAMVAPAGLAVRLTSSNTTVASLTGSDTITINSGSKSGSTLANNLAAGNVPGSATISGVVTTTGYTNLAVTSATINTTYIGNVGYKLAFDAISQATVANDTSSYQTLKVRIQDYNGNQVTADNSTQVSVVDPTGDVTFAADKAFSVNVHTNAITVTAVNGTATVYARSQTSGDYTYKAFAGSLGTVSSTGNFKWGAATAVAVNYARPSTIANDGTSRSKLSFVIEDQFGNTVEDSAAAVTLERVGGGTPYTTVDGATTANASAGYATFYTKSGMAVGADTFRATSVGLANSGNVVVTTTNVGAAYKLGVMSISSGPWTSGTDYTVRIAVQDFGGNTVSSDAGRQINLQVITGSANIATATATTADGYATFTVSATKKGSLVLRATTSGLNVNTVDTNTVTVNPGYPSKLLVDADATTLANDNLSNVPIYVYTVDDYGNYSPLVNGGVTVNLQVDASTIGGFGAGHSTTSTATIANSSSSGTSAANFYSTGVIGSAVVTASAAGFESATLTMSTSNVGAATRLAVDSITDKAAFSMVPSSAWVADSTLRSARVQAVTVRVVDNAGLQVTNGQGGRNIVISPSKAAYILTDNDNPQVPGNWSLVAAAGTYQAATDNTGAVTFYVISPNSGSLTYTVSENAATPLPGVVASGNFTTGSASGMIADATPGVIAANGTSQSLIRVRVVDTFGNTVTSYNGTAYLAITGPGDLQASSISIASGVGTVYVTSRAAAGTVVVTPSATDLSGTVTPATVQVGSAPSITGTVSGPYTIVSSASHPSLTGAVGPYALADGDTLTVAYTDTATPANNASATATIAAFATKAEGAALVFPLDLSAAAVADRTLTVTTAGPVTAAITVSAKSYADAAALLAELNAQQALLGINTFTFTMNAGKIDVTTSAKGTGATLSVSGPATGVLGYTAATPGVALGVSNVANVAQVTVAELVGLINVAGVTDADNGSGALNLVSSGVAAVGPGFTVTVSGTAASKVFGATLSSTGKNENDKFTITSSFAGAPFALTLAANTYADATAMATQINTQLGAAGQAFVTASASNGKVVLTAVQSGASVTLTITTVANSAYADLGFTAGTSVSGQ